MPTITLNTLFKDTLTYEVVKSFFTQSIVMDPVTQVVYNPPVAPVTGTLLRYYDEDGVLRKYLVSQTLAQVFELIKPAFKYFSGSTGTVNISGTVKEITVVSVSENANIVIDGGDSITLPASADASVTITLTPNNLVNPTIVFTNTSSYLITYN